MDVKVPWELARMQHLPHLVWAYTLAQHKQSGFATPEHYSHEFRNQVLDFIACNPPRFGVNWTTSMDVGFRAVNWLTAYDLFRAQGAVFDAEFEAEFVRSLYQHGHHIIHHLEYDPVVRANHYLADIVSLIFVAAFLPRTPEIDSWLAFGVQELVKEVKLQFTPDGANFEASTSYHRMSTEMVVYATALLLGLPSEKRAALHDYQHHLHRAYPKLSPAPMTLLENGLPTWYIERLARMAEFTRTITAPDGKVPQIGDNDSGRFLKLTPSFEHRRTAEMIQQYANLEGYAVSEEVYWDEEVQNHSHLLDAIGAFWGESTTLEGSIVAGLLKSGRLPLSKPAHPVVIGDDAVWEQIEEQFQNAPTIQRQSIIFPVDHAAHDLERTAYPDFGLFIFRSPSIFLLVHCGPNGQYDNGGHAHNDQLGIELHIDGKKQICDPGTYVYTPLPTRRNQYRSVQAHFAPRVAGKEPGELRHGLFHLGNQALARCLYWGEHGFIGCHEGYGTKVYRMVKVNSQNIEIFDFAEGAVLEPLPVQDWGRSIPPYSPKYGWVERCVE